MTTTLRLLVAVAISGSATSPAADLAREIEVLEEVVITATPLRKAALLTAQPVFALSGESLLRARAASLGETLASQPGLSASSFGPLASRPIIRGQGGLRVQTYQDGADTLDAAALSDDHAVTLDPLLAERIEVVRGPAALMFGNAAAAGAINVITPRIPIERLEQTLQGGLEVRADSAALERAMIGQLAARLGDHLQLHVDAHQQRSADLHIPGFAWSSTARADAIAAGEPVDLSRGRLVNSAGEADGGGAGLAWVGERQRFGVSSSRYDSEYGLPGLGEEAGEPPDIRLRMTQRREDFSGEWQPASGAVTVLRLRASRNDYQHVELEPTGDVGTRYAQLGTELRLSGEHGDAIGTANGSRGAFGIQVRKLDFDAEGEEAFLPPSVTRNAGLFLFEEREFGALTLEAGARYEYQTVLDYADDSFSASLGAVWSMREDLSLSLQLASTERHPTATELYAEGPHVAVRRYEIGDASLGTETGRSIDLGVRWNTADAYAAISVFITDYRDYLYAKPSVVPDDLDTEGLSLVRYVAGDARFTGVELEWSRPRLLQTAVGALGLRVFGDLVRAADGAGEPLPFIPPHRLGAALSLDGKTVGIGLEAIWHDDQTRVAAAERSTLGYTMLNLELSLRPRIAGRPVLLFIRGSNLLDEEARRHTSALKDYAPLAGRAVSASLRWTF
ncbi:MAG: TonB-dependent receptor [Sinobacteraceae bacterium]|nr:TonB-dependent receptor [Nevskiaceae bacterium]